MAKSNAVPQGANDDKEWWHHLRRKSLWEGICISLVLFVAGAGLFFLLDWWEGSEGVLAGPWPLVLLYSLGGKWLVGGVCWTIGLLGLVQSVYRFLFTDSI